MSWMLFLCFYSYRFIKYKSLEKVEGSATICTELLRKANIDEDETWKVGKTKVRKIKIVFSSPKATIPDFYFLI